MKRKFEWIKSVFVRPRKIIDMLFLGTAYLIIIPIVVLGISLTLIFTASFKEQIDRINTNTIGYVAEILEENISAVYNAVYVMCSDNSILNYESFSGDNYDHAVLLNDISTTIRRQQMQNEIIEEIYIFYKKSGVVIGNNYIMSVAEKQLAQYYGKPTEELAQFLEINSGKFVCSNGNSEKEEKHILYARPIDKKFSKEGDIYAICVLDDEVIHGLMNMMSLEEIGQTILLDNSYNILLGEEQQYSKYEERVKTVFSNDGLEPDMNFPVLIKKIGTSNLNLCFIVDNMYYITAIRHIWTVIIGIAIVIVTVSTFIAKFYIRRLYRPFGNIVSMFKADEQEYGEKSELEFFEEKYIEIKNMKKELGEYKNSWDCGMKELFFQNFMKGFYKADYQQYMQELDIVLNTSHYTTLLIKIDNLKSVVKNIKMNYYRSFIKDKLLEVIESQNKEYYRQCNYFYDGEYIGIIICHYEEIKSLEQDMACMQRVLFTTLGITVSICIGDTVHATDELIEEYKILSDAMLQMKFCKPGTILTMQNYKKVGKYVDFYKYKDIVKQYIEKRDYENLDTLIDGLFMNSNVFYAEVIQLVTGFLTILMDFMEQKDRNEIYSYDEISRLDNTSEIAEYIKSLCRNIGEKMYMESANRNELYDKIMSYIAANYMKDISLTIMAKSFGLSSSYFSRYFKEITGKNYSELVNSYRVEKAKELIDQEENIKLFQVGELVGFVSYKAFATSFKKYMGESPESYKKAKTNQNISE